MSRLNYDPSHGRQNLAGRSRSSAWYIAGALLRGAPRAQGSVYLLMKRKTADVLAVALVVAVVAASVCVLLTPINYALVDPVRLSGRVMQWQWVRSFSPFINLYAAIFLIGGAIVSAARFRTMPDKRGKYVGNIVIAIGGLLPGIGGTLTRFGHVEVLYVTEFVGLLLIYAGYRLNIRPLPEVAGSAKVPALARHGAVAVPSGSAPGP